MKIDVIVTGTSQFSNLENKIRNIAKKVKIFSITFLDHYVNYRKRFVFNNKLQLPNEIWSFDIHSYNIAKKTFKNVIINFFL